MTGGLMQLVATGAQDVWLTGNPMVTYFKVVYRRHTNFAMESVYQTFNTAVDFGATVTSLISRSGDLISTIYLQATLPDIPADPDNYKYTVWTDNIGHHLIKQADIEIGGQLIDRQYGDWLEIWSQLTVPAGQLRGYREMIGQDPAGPFGLNSGLQRDRGGSVLPGRTIYVPLMFWFCRNVGLALPLIALQYHEVKITLQLRKKSELLACFDTQASGDTIAATVPAMGGLTETGLWVDYIYLDTDERRRFAQVTHEYLIDQIQRNEFDITGSVTNQEVTLELNFNHTVKELVWVSQYKAAVTKGHVQWSNYTDRSSLNFPTSDGGVLNLTDLGAIIYDALTTKRASSLNFQCATNPTHNKPPGCLNPTYRGSLQLNGNERFTQQSGDYFNKMQTFRHHTNIPESPGINVYSFSLKPEMYQPSGTCNFSRLDKAHLILNLRPGVNHGTLPTDDSITANFLQSDLTVRVYAVNYNIFRIMSGMGALAYAH
jgi:hypothetical protein